MAKVKNFKTIFPAVSVPLNEDYSINEPEFRAYLRWIKSFYGKGMDGLVCNGHTGEITGLTRAERKRVVEICAEECGDVMTIISGVNCENTAESIEMAKEAKEAGVKLAVGGKGMLLWQGAASYKLYTGLEMPTDEYQKFQAENEGK